VVVDVVAVAHNSTASSHHLRDEYCVAFEDGDFDPKVRREHIKGRLLDEDWIEKKIEISKRLLDHGKSRKKEKKRKNESDCCPFTYPTSSKEEKGVKRHRAMNSGWLQSYRREFGQLLSEQIIRKPNISEESVVLVNAYDEAKFKLQSQLVQLKSLSTPFSAHFHV
jgi:hypothetical protein